MAGRGGGRGWGAGGGVLLIFFLSIYISTFNYYLVALSCVGWGRVVWGGVGGAGVG